ncbi:MAG: 50S ribosomal protein L25, partial [Chloroflexi bacterium]|nr:50S ribosomal protein L25 [Chloroflexota bacterium]
MEEPDSVVRVSDLPIPENATLLTDLEELVVRIELPRVAEEVTVAEQVGLEAGAEGEEAATEEGAEE